MVERGNPDLIKKIMRTSQESHGYTNNENNKNNSYIPEQKNIPGGCLPHLKIQE